MNIARDWFPAQFCLANKIVKKNSGVSLPDTINIISSALTPSVFFYLFIFHQVQHCWETLIRNYNILAKFNGLCQCQVTVEITSCLLLPCFSWKVPSILPHPSAAKTLHDVAGCSAAPSKPNEPLCNRSRVSSHLGISWQPGCCVFACPSIS